MAVMAMAGCRQAKLSVADEQFARGEYYDTSVTYKKVYNQLKKKEQRPERGMVAFRLGNCYKRLNMSVRAANAYQNAIRYEYPDKQLSVRDIQNMMRDHYDNTPMDMRKEPGRAFFCKFRLFLQ